MNHEGTAWRVRIDSRRASQSCSSSQPSGTWLASPCIDPGFTVGEFDEGVRLAQPIQAPGPLRADAPYRDSQLLVDLGIRMWRIAEQHGQQLLAAGRQLGKGGPQPRVPL